MPEKKITRTYRVTLEPEYDNGKMITGKRIIEVHACDIEIQDVAESYGFLLLSDANGAAVFCRDAATVKECIALDSLGCDATDDVPQPKKPHPRLQPV